MSERRIELVVPADLAGKRIDAVLGQARPDISRSDIQKSIKDGQLLVNQQKVVKTSYKVSEGDSLVLIHRPPQVALHVEPQPFPLEVLFEDEHILVINKPTGIAMHPGAGDPAEVTVAGAALAHVGRPLPDPDSEVSRPGIVHRLDKHTTGAVVIAKSREALQNLSAQFAAKTNERSYLALLSFSPKQPINEVESYLCRDPKNRQRFTWRPTDQEPQAGWRLAKSHFKTVAEFGDRRLSLAEVKLETGRTHQIRVHAKQLGGHVVGDPLYGKSIHLPRTLPVALGRALNSLSRQMLHAASLGFDHPLTKERVSFSAPTPEDFQQILDLLEPYRNCRMT